jgi:hypothetical protein
MISEHHIAKNNPADGIGVHTVNIYVMEIIKGARKLTLMVGGA